MLSRWLPFEDRLVEVEEQIEELKRLASREGLDLSEKVARLEDHKRTLMQDIFADLNPWEKVQMARHPKRPYTLDYISSLCTDWIELHGDRAFGDDGAVVAGFAKFNGKGVAIIGHQKGRDTKERAARNFGQPSPEGLRKAQRVMQLAERFDRPIFSFIDTTGAACSPAAEERGISEAIARTQMIMSTLRVPIIAIITGEGCSGGAIATAVGDRVLMLEHAYYSVIAPESCASILYRDPSKAADSAEALKITANDALRFGVIEEIIKEPLGGAHRDFAAMGVTLSEVLRRHLGELDKISARKLVDGRYARFRKLGILEDPKKLLEEKIKTENAQQAEGANAPSQNGAAVDSSATAQPEKVANKSAA
jgi:acetyl-CoA carboxylase carboxyl transferase subunit alpha